MSSQRLKCMDFLSNDASSKRASEFMPYVHERDEQGNLISPNTQRRHLKKLTPVKKSNRGELTIRNILQITKDQDIEQNFEITQAARVPTDFCNQQFFVYNDWKYLEHPAKKSKMRKLHNLLNQASQQRIPRQPSIVDYNPNYDFNKKKVIQNIIIPKEIPKRTIRYKSQCMDEDSNIKREETPRQERQKLNINMKQNPYYLEMVQKMKFDQGIQDISNFQRKIEQTIQKCHLSKEKILKGS